MAKKSRPPREVASFRDQVGAHHGVESALVETFNNMGYTPNLRVNDYTPQKRTCHLVVETSGGRGVIRVVFVPDRADEALEYFDKINID